MCKAERLICEEGLTDLLSGRTRRKVTARSNEERASGGGRTRESDGFKKIG